MKRHSGINALIVATSTGSRITTTETTQINSEEKDSKDKRSYIIKLTESGKEEYDNHHHLHCHLIEELVNALGESEAESFFKNLKNIQELM